MFTMWIFSMISLIVYVVVTVEAGDLWKIGGRVVIWGMG